MSTPIIQINHLYKVYAGFALSDLSLKIEPGDVMGLIGPNGAGKTTLIKCIMHLTPINAGEIQICGQSMYEDGFFQKQNFRKVRKELAYVPDEPVFYDYLSPYEYLQVVAKLINMPKNAITGKIERLLSNLKLDKYKYTLIHALSKGNKQRLSIATALLQDSAILILDEPNNALDPGGKAIVRKLLHEYMAERPDRAIFVSSHHLHELDEICNKITVLNQDGSIVAFGNKEAVKSELGSDRSLEHLYQRLIEGEN